MAETCQPSMGNIDISAAGKHRKATAWNMGTSILHRLITIYSSGPRASDCREDRTSTSPDQPSSLLVPRMGSCTRVSSHEARKLHI